ncbi:hypothetical protein Q31b_52710 [Novipirellula aureliae]|uniref:Uncharacterized protein n=1 Tax=Novipirellula aureliae TaxID=2527966 RepID=A0A5C6DLN4_9BACT|nr:hypothetical protein Q31b_52710 [Novipirellula aureliae]
MATFPGLIEAYEGRTMTCTGGRLATFIEMESQLSVPRDVGRSPTKTLTGSPVSRFFMETTRWIATFIALAIAAVSTGANFFLACRKLILFTSSGPSYIPVVGFTAALLGLLLVPKTQATLSAIAVTAGCVFLCFDISPHCADVINSVRARLTGRKPS